MFKIRFLFRLLTNSPVLSTSIRRVTRTHLKTTAKNIKPEHVTALNQDTLTGRILLYLNVDNAVKPDNSVKSEQFLRDLQMNSIYLQQLKTDDIVKFLCGLHQSKINQIDFTSALKHLDVELCLRLPEMTTNTTIKVLNVYMKMISNRINEKQFYQQAMKKLHRSRHLLAKNDFLQLMFYLGLQKKSPDAQTALRECILVINDEFIANLTIEELCIICNSTFKTSTKILNRKLLEKIRSCIDDNLILLKDHAFFVTLIKTIRHNRYQDENLLNTISYASFFNQSINDYSFSTMCHIMALFADYFYYDQNFLQVMSRKCIEQLKNTNFVSKHKHLNEQLRGKDVHRLLWVLGMYSEMPLLEKNDLQDVIIPKLMTRIKAGEFQNNINMLIDIVLYLWMLDYRPYELVPYILTKRNLDILENKSKFSSLRLNLLLYTIHSEEPNLLQKLQIKPNFHKVDYSWKYQLNKRPLLSKILRSLQSIGKDVNLKHFEITQEIPYLNIMGITGYASRSQKSIYVEILDEYTSLKNTEENVPVGLMALKLRLLERLPEGLIVVSQKELENMTEAEVLDYFISEIDFNC